MNIAQVKALFEREAVLLGSRDGVPDYRVATLFGEAAMRFAHRMDNDSHKNIVGYGTGDYTLFGLSLQGFMAAASYFNVQQLKPLIAAKAEERQGERTDLNISQKEEPMMHDKEELSLMADIMAGIISSDEWNDIQLHDPDIKAAENRRKRVLESAKAYLPREVYVELSDAQGGEVAAYIVPAIMYGIHVAEVIREVSANPTELSRYYLERRGGSQMNKDKMLSYIDILRNASLGGVLREAADAGIEALERSSPCDLCRFDPPSSCDGKPCCCCPAEEKIDA